MKVISSNMISKGFPLFSGSLKSQNSDGTNIHEQHYFWPIFEKFHSLKLSKRSDYSLVSNNRPQPVNLVFINMFSHFAKCKRNFANFGLKRFLTFYEHFIIYEYL